MPWDIFAGTGVPTVPSLAWKAIPPPPPWRGEETRFVTTPELLAAVNAALHLRRPLLLTGPPGSGKSTLATVIARELQLGSLLEWHVTSRSTLADGLYQYDALGRLHATQTRDERADEVERFVTLGPLGTALADKEHPRAVLIDEIDKSDLDLPGDLLHVLELGEFKIPPLVRAAESPTDDHAGPVPYLVQGVDDGRYEVLDGVVRRTHWPVIVMTSNGEQTFPPPFLRRCVRYEMATPKEGFLAEVVAAHLGEAAEQEQALIKQFAERLRNGENLALDQLLNVIYLVTGKAAPDSLARARVQDILLKELAS